MRFPTQEEEDCDPVRLLVTAVPVRRWTRAECIECVTSWLGFSWWTNPPQPIGEGCWLSAENGTTSGLTFLRAVTKEPMPKRIPPWRKTCYALQGSSNRSLLFLNVNGITNTMCFLCKCVTFNGNFHYEDYWGETLENTTKVSEGTVYNSVCILFKTKLRYSFSYQDWRVSSIIFVIKVCIKGLCRLSMWNFQFWLENNKIVVKFLSIEYLVWIPQNSSELGSVSHKVMNHASNIHAKMGLQIVYYPTIGPPVLAVPVLETCMPMHMRILY